MSYKMPKEYVDALRLTMEDAKREPTDAEKAVYMIALEHGKDRQELSQFVCGEHPGWFYRQPFTSQNEYRGDVQDVYIYSGAVDKRRTFVSCHGPGQAWDVLGDCELYAAVHNAFQHGATKIEVRPMKELEL